MLLINSINRIRIAEFFRLDEFQCPCCKRVMLHPLLLQKMKGLRQKIGKPVMITSGYRCTCYNEQVGGVKTSYHLLGMAADIHVPGVSLQDVLTIAQEMRFKGIGFYPERNFLHLDVRPTHPNYWQG